MLINLYGDKGLVFQTLASGFKEAHLQDKLKFDVVAADKVGADFKEAVKNAYNAKFLDDADMIIRFAEPVEQTTGPEEDENGEAKTDGQENGSEQETADDEGKSEQAPSKEGSDDEKANVSEAETTASGADLKKKVIDTIKRRLFISDADDVELSDLDGFKEGYNVFFTKVSIKDDGVVGAES